MSIKNKLQRLKPHLTSGTSSEKRLPETKSQAEIPFMDVWTNENVAPYWVDDNYCLIREVRYPLEYKHGNYAFRDFLGAVSEWNNTNNAHPLSAKGHQAEDLFFFDTETTGLGEVLAIPSLFSVMPECKGMKLSLSSIFCQIQVLKCRCLKAFWKMLIIQH